MENRRKGDILKFQDIEFKIESEKIDEVSVYLFRDWKVIIGFVEDSNWVFWEESIHIWVYILGRNWKDSQEGECRLYSFI